MVAPMIAAAGISAGASLLGGLFNRNAQKKANKANLPTAQVAAWEDAGINPIMGITQGQWIPQQAVSMGDSFANAGGALARGMELNHEEELANTGIRKENEELKEALSDLSKRRELSNIEKIGINPLPSSVQTDMGTVPMSDVRSPTPLTDEGYIDLRYDDGGTGVTLKPRERIVTSDGTTSDVTLGPDADEWFSGLFFEAGAFMRERGRNINKNRMADEAAYAPPSVDTMWPYELGDKPSFWDDASEVRRTNYLYRKNPNMFPLM